MADDQQKDEPLMTVAEFAARRSVAEVVPDRLSHAASRRLPSCFAPHLDQSSWPRSRVTPSWRPEIVHIHGSRRPQRDLHIIIAGRVATSRRRYLASTRTVLTRHPRNLS